MHGDGVHCQIQDMCEGKNDKNWLGTTTMWKRAYQQEMGREKKVG